MTANSSAERSRMSELRSGPVASVYHPAGSWGTGGTSSATGMVLVVLPCHFGGGCVGEGSISGLAHMQVYVVGFFKL